MRCQWLGLALTGVIICAGFSFAIPKQGAPASAPPRSANLRIAADLNQELSKFQRVPMPFHSQGLSAREQELVKKLVEASQYLEQIYWRQSDPAGLALFRSLEGSTAPQDVALRRFLMINGSRYDLIRNNEPFVGTAPMILAERRLRHYEWEL